MIDVFKIGGNVIDSTVSLDAFVARFASLSGSRILIHGGGKLATALAARLDIPTRMIDGRRVTDRDTLDVVTMVYAGLINKQIVAMLQAAGVNAIGLCGADANLIPARRRPSKPIDYGFVGDINPDDINVDALRSLLDAGFVPVVCAITRSLNPDEGLLLNSNADSVASALAIAASRIGTTNLTFCFEKKGVLADGNDEDSVISHIDTAKFNELKANGTIHSGMLPKIENALKAVAYGVNSVIIKRWDMINTPLGTVIQ